MARNKALIRTEVARNTKKPVDMTTFYCRELIEANWQINNLTQRGGVAERPFKREEFTRLCHGREEHAAWQINTVQSGDPDSICTGDLAAMDTA